MNKKLNLKKKFLAGLAVPLLSSMFCVEGLGFAVHCSVPGNVDSTDGRYGGSESEQTIFGKSGEGKVASSDSFGNSGGISAESSESEVTFSKTRVELQWGTEKMPVRLGKPTSKGDRSFANAYYSIWGTLDDHKHVVFLCIFDNYKGDLDKDSLGEKLSKFKHLEEVHIYSNIEEFYVESLENYENEVMVYLPNETKIKGEHKLIDYDAKHKMIKVNKKDGGDMIEPKISEQIDESSESEVTFSEEGAELQWGEEKMSVFPEEPNSEGDRHFVNEDRSVCGTFDKDKHVIVLQIFDNYKGDLDNDSLVRKLHNFKHLQYLSLSKLGTKEFDVRSLGNYKYAVRVYLPSETKIRGKYKLIGGNAKRKIIKVNKSESEVKLSEVTFLENGVEFQWGEEKMTALPAYGSYFDDSKNVCVYDFTTKDRSVNLEVTDDGYVVHMYIDMDYNGGLDKDSLGEKLSKFKHLEEVHIYSNIEEFDVESLENCQNAVEVYLPSETKIKGEHKLINYDAKYKTIKVNEK